MQQNLCLHSCYVLLRCCVLDALAFQSDTAAGPLFCILLQVVSQATQNSQQCVVSFIAHNYMYGNSMPLSGESLWVSSPWAFPFNMQHLQIQNHCVCAALLQTLPSTHISSCYKLVIGCNMVPSTFQSCGFFVVVCLFFNDSSFKECFGVAAFAVFLQLLIVLQI